MISTLQKTRLIAKLLQQRLQSGHVPIISLIIQDITKFLGNGRRFGMPLAILRPAKPGELIGGLDGSDISDTLGETREDLDLLYTALISLSSKVIDTYDVFSVRYDRLMLKAAQLRQEALTLLAQQSAGTKNSVNDTFKTLDLIDLSRTTTQIDLAEGIATVPINSSRSVRYNGARTKVVKITAPVGTQQPGPSFSVVFSPYRTNAWYVNIPVGQEYNVVVNVTGADFEKGDSEEILLNAIKIDPTGPIHVQIDWSPDGFNWHDLDPVPTATIRSSTTFHFAPVSVGFIRFRLKHSEELSLSNAGQLRPIGLKGVEFYQRGFSSSASLYSSALQFRDPVHTLVATIDSQVPLGTRIASYVSQGTDGPWLPIGTDPITFDTILWVERPVPSPLEEEVPGLPSTMWQFSIDAGKAIPELGQMIAGRDQIHISAFSFDWSKVGDVNHIPLKQDWTNPYGQVREAVFTNLSDRYTLAAGDFFDEQNPVAVDINAGTNSMILSILQDNGVFILQPGYNYRVRAFVWCQFPITLERQQIGVVNNNAAGGLAGTVIAPFSFYVNGTKIYQQVGSVSTVSQLSGMAFTTTVPLAQGWNILELYLQIPVGVTPGVSGVATSGIYLYFQPNLFATNRQVDLGIQYLQAYQDPWKRVSEFDLRYNIAPGVKQAWAWKYEYISTGSTTLNITKVLLNHDPSNSRLATTPHASQYTIDGQNATYPTNLLLRYPVEAQTFVEANGRRIYFRADFFMGNDATSPPIMRSYKILVN